MKQLKYEVYITIGDDPILDYEPDAKVSQEAMENIARGIVNEIKRRGLVKQLVIGDPSVIFTIQSEQHKGQVYTYEHKRARRR